MSESVKKRKKWIHIRGTLYMCPNCRKRFNFDKRILWKCCPICEQKMNGVEEQKEEFATETGRVKDFLNVLPSADVVEVRHGKWSHDYIQDGVEYNDWFNLHCSVCGEMQRDAWGKWNYCPYCGAKMDGEEHG